ncbi:hypothetical protein PUN28_005467 [Cardiocondyla obscurior]|uniref:Uncharacterized protein n=1 Tax=Cardiocondyla obscurior TaxID=286306 RepID=A0AAW2GHY9_9HYME
MEEPQPGGTALVITVSSTPGKYADHFPSVSLYAPALNLKYEKDSQVPRDVALNISTNGLGACPAQLRKGAFLERWWKFEWKVTDVTGALRILAERNSESILNRIQT